MAHTHTIGAGGNYATLALCIAAHKNDTFIENHVWTYISNVAAEGAPDYHWPITTANYSLTIDGAGYTSTVNTAGWGRINPMGGTNRYLIKNLKIVASAQDLWAGLVSLDMNRAGQNSIVTLDRLTLNGNGYNCCGILNPGTSVAYTVNITNCVVHGCGKTAGILNQSANGTFNIENTVCHNNTGYGIGNNPTGAAGSIKNCVCFGNSSTEYMPGSNVTVSYCAADDTSIPAINGNLRSITVANEFVSTTVGNADYLLPKSTGQLHDSGVAPIKSTLDYNGLPWRVPYPIGCRQSPVTNTTTPAPATTTAATPELVLWADGFEGAGLATNYQDYSLTGLDISTETAHTGTHCLRQSYTTGMVNSGYIVRYGAYPSHVFMRWYHKFGTGFTAVFPPKMARIRYRIHSSWVVSMVINLWIESSNKACLDCMCPESTQANETGYLPNLVSTYTFDATQVNKWVCFEIEVKLNTLGLTDGLMRLWVDGQQVAERLSVDFRGSTNIELNEAMLDTYWNAGAPSALKRYYDDFQVTAESAPFPTTTTTTTALPGTTLPPSSYLTIGSIFHIMATDLDVDAVKIEISRNSGSTWVSIISSILINHVTVGDAVVYDDVDYHWTVTGPAGTCLFKITGLGSESDISYTSDEYVIVALTTTPGPTTTPTPTTSPVPLTTTPTPFTPGATYTGRRISHNFPIAGTWTITLTENDGEGNTSVKVRNYSAT